MLKNHPRKFNREKNSLSFNMAYIIQTTQVKCFSYLPAMLSIMELPLIKCWGIHVKSCPHQPNNYILVKFTEDSVEIIADIETMFYQVLVDNQHRNLLNFLRWKNGYINEQPQDYHMNIHVFGGRRHQVVLTTHCEEQQEIMNEGIVKN